MGNYRPSDKHVFDDREYIPSSNFEFGLVFNFIDTQYTPNDIFDFTDNSLPIVTTGALVAITDNAVAGFIGEYEIGVTRLLTVEQCSVVENTSKVSLQTCMAQEQAKSDRICFFSLQENTQKLSESVIGKTENGIFLDHEKCSSVDDAESIVSDTCFVFENATPLNLDEINAMAEKGVFLINSSCSIFQYATVKNADNLCSVIQDSSQAWRNFIRDEGELEDPRHKPSSQFDFIDNNFTPDLVFSFPDAINWIPAHKIYSEGQAVGVVTNRVCGTWGFGQWTEVKQCATVEDARQPPPGRTAWVDKPRPPVLPEPPSGETITVPRQEVYTMLNVISVTLDDDITPIQVDNITLSLNGSTWTFNAELLEPDEISIVKQQPNGTAIKLHITVNGYTWYVLVEKIQTRRVFGKKSVKISGRGLTALLTKPYVQQKSVTHGADMDIRVLADTILPVGWNELGDMYWLLGDQPIGSPVFWVVDGGAYSYVNKTPLEAIKELADNIGAIIVPSRNSQEIYFKSRYPVLPWNFDAVSVDIAIPDDAILELTEEPVSSFQANGVYLHGNEIGGELAFVRLNGTAGDRLASTTNNSLMTSVTGLRHLGERILGGQYEQPAIKSVTTFMDGSTVPLMENGDFVGFTVDSVETKGIVNTVSISVKRESDGVEVTQTVTIGESTPNAWVAFNELLPKQPMLVGELTSTDGVTSAIALLDAGVVRVRGTGAIGNKYYIRSGEIVSEAPDLNQYNIVL